jgi:hypothetical protein
VYEVHRLAGEVGEATDDRALPDDRKAFHGSVPWLHRPTSPRADCTPSRAPVAGTRPRPPYQEILRFLPLTKPAPVAAIRAPATTVLPT